MLMMKLTSLIVMAVVLGLACGTGGSNADQSQTQLQPAPVKTTTTPRDGNYPAKGKVTKINLELGSVELDHEDIPGVMSRMIMEFYVKDKAILDDVKVGDEVDFVLEYKHPAETIVSLKKAQ